MSPKPQITFITRYYPPSPNINGESICDMVLYLQQQYGIESTVITMDRAFEGGGGTRREPLGHVIRLKTLFKSNHKYLRFLTFLYDGFNLIRHSLKFRDTFIVVTSSPPLLPFWASLLYGKKIKWAFWAFDLFPEGFSATNIISEKNPFYKWVIKKTYEAHPARIIALGPKQAGHLAVQFGKDVPVSVLPCGVFFYQDKSDTVPSWHEADKIIFGYCGNVNDAHNPEFIKAVVDNVDPARHKIILALYGNKAPELKEYANGKPGVVLVNNVPRNQLHFIDIHLVSLITKWTHVAVPSKAVSAITMGCPILFCGSPESDNWAMFQEAAWFINENADIRKQVGGFIKKLSRAEIDFRKSRTPALYEQLKRYVIEAYRAVAAASVQLAGTSALPEDDPLTEMDPAAYSGLSLKEYFKKFEREISRRVSLDSLTAFFTNATFETVKPYLNRRQIKPSDNRFSRVEIVHDDNGKIKAITWDLKIKLSELEDFFGPHKMHNEHYSDTTAFVFISANPVIGSIKTRHPKWLEKKAGGFEYMAEDKTYKLEDPEFEFIQFSLRN